MDLLKLLSTDGKRNMKYTKIKHLLEMEIHITMEKELLKKPYRN